eukprot:3883404-Pyramimonas_sp.AAC.1
MDANSILCGRLVGQPEGDALTPVVHGVHFCLHGRAPQASAILRHAERAHGVPQETMTAGHRGQALLVLPLSQAPLVATLELAGAQPGQRLLLLDHALGHFGLEAFMPTPLATAGDDSILLQRICGAPVVVRAVDHPGEPRAEMEHDSPCSRTL